MKNDGTSTKFLVGVLAGLLIMAGALYGYCCCDVNGLIAFVIASSGISLIGYAFDQL